MGPRTSPAVAAEVRATIDRAIDYATAEMQRVLSGSPLGDALPVPLIAQLAAAAFLASRSWPRTAAPSTSTAWPPPSPPSCPRLHSHS